LLECGGKDAVIVDADADVKAAADAIAWGATANSGQTCAGVERVYVHKSVADELIAEVKRILTDVEPGSEEGAAYGPMTMPSQIDIVKRHIESALANGAEAVLGGPESVKGPFIEPVVLVGTDENSEAVTEETFGPTITIRVVDTIDEAIELANKSKYGLSSSVYSKKNGLAIGRRLGVGAASVNSVRGLAAIPGLRFRGERESGVGRIHGEPGLREFTRPHSSAIQKFAIPGMALMSYSRTAQNMQMLRKVVPFLHGRNK